MSEPFDTFGPPPPEEGAQLDPREAATLLEQATRRAQRQFDLQPPILMLVAAATVLVAYGAVWLSVRHQHPYTGPTGAALGVLYGVLALWIGFLAIFMRRALGGRSSRRRRLEGIVFAAIWICVYVFQGALHHVDPSASVAYGVYPAVAPLLVVGAAAAGYEAARENAGRACFAAAAVALGAFGAFAGPATVWGVMGIGLCSLLFVALAVQLRQRRAHV